MRDDVHKFVKRDVVSEFAVDTRVTDKHILHLKEKWR